MIRTPYKKTLLWAGAVFMLAFGLRLAHILAISRSSPFFDILPGDMGAYDRWAQKILQEGWVGKEVFYQDPLYPYLLALIYKTIGRDFFWVYTVQAVLGAATCGLVVLIGERAVNRTVGVIGGLLYAFYAPAIYHDGLVLKVSLGAFLLLLAVFLLVGGENRHRPRPGLVAAGIVLGLASLVRANFLLLLPVLVLAFLLNREAAPRQRALMAVLFLLGSLLVLGPVMIRNYLISHDWVLTTAQAGQNFYIGNNPQAFGTYTGLPFVRADPLYEREDFQREAEKRLGRAMKPSEVSRYWLEQGVRFMKTDPAAFLRLFWKKTLLVLNFYEIADNDNFYFHQRYSKVLDLSPVAFGLIGPLFLLGFLLMLLRPFPPTVLIGLVQATYLFSVVIFYVFSRYRMPVMPLCCLCAAYALHDLWNRACASQWRPLAFETAFLALALVFVNHEVMPPFDFSHSFADEAIAYEMKGNQERAVVSYEQALRINPNYLRALERLARVQMQLRHFAEAKKNYTRILAITPNSKEARFQLLVLQQAGY